MKMTVVMVMMMVTTVAVSAAQTKVTADDVNNDGGQR